MKSGAILLLMFLMSGYFVSHAQKGSVQSMGGGGFIIGYGNLNVARLHSFVPAEVQNFGNNQIILGGTGHAFIDRFVIGGSGYGIVGNTIKTDSLKISLGGGLGTFDLGYLAVNRDKMKIFPMLGIGGAGYGIGIAKNRNLPIKNVISNPGQEININVGGLVIDASININFIPIMQYDQKADSYGGFMTGLKIGYVYGIPSSDWRYTGGDVIGGPNFGIKMFYVKLVLGGFGYRTVKQP